MPLGRLVPWHSWEEWHQVRLGLFSADHEHCQLAINRVSTWDARGRLPLGADITACLQAIRGRDTSTAPVTTTTTTITAAAVGSLNQPKAHALQQAEPQSLLRLQYAMAIIRLVNGISDSSQKGRVAVSVAQLADDAGLPRMLVDVRHEAAHNELPSLAMLRVAAAEALKWLETSYWQRQADHLVSCRTRISELLGRYIQLQHAAAAKQLGAAPAGSGGEQAGGAPSRQEEGAEAGGDRGAEGYSGPAGQRERREVLAELLERVQYSAQLLVAPLLDDGLMEQHGRGTSSCGLDAGGAAAERVSVAAWEATIAGLSATWTPLRQLLLAGAVRRLAEAPADGPTVQGSAGAAARGRGGGLRRVAGASQGLGDLEQWVARLLGTARARGDAKKGKAGSKRKSASEVEAGDAPAWSPAPQQLRQLAGSCVRALAQTPTVGALPLEQGARATALESAAEQLLRRSGAKGSGAASLQRLLSLACLEGSAGEGPQQQRGSSPAAPPDWERRVQARGEALRAAQDAQGKLLQGAAAAAAAAVGTLPASHRKRRWVRVDSWAPCALGMLPCANSPAGRSAALDACARQPAGAQPAGADVASATVLAGHELDSGLGQQNKRDFLGALERKGCEEAVEHVMAAGVDFFARFDHAEAATEDADVQQPISLEQRMRAVAGAVKLL